MFRRIRRARPWNLRDLEDGLLLGRRRSTESLSSRDGSPPGSTHRQRFIFTFLRTHPISHILADISRVLSSLGIPTRPPGLIAYPRRSPSPENPPAVQIHVDVPAASSVRESHIPAGARSRPQSAAFAQLASLPRESDVDWVLVDDRSETAGIQALGFTRINWNTSSRENNHARSLAREHAALRTASAIPTSVDSRPASIAVGNPSLYFPHRGVNVSLLSIDVVNEHLPEDFVDVVVDVEAPNSNQSRSVGPIVYDGDPDHNTIPSHPHPEPPVPPLRVSNPPRDSRVRDDSPLAGDTVVARRIPPLRSNTGLTHPEAPWEETETAHDPRSRTHDQEREDDVGRPGSTSRLSMSSYSTANDS